MEKELLISKLKEKVGTTNVSDVTIGAYVDAILPTITSDEIVNDAFLDAHANVIKVTGGQISHDASIEINRYKEEHPVQKDQGGKGGEETPAGLETVMAKLDEIQKENQTLKERIDNSETEMQREELKKKVIEGMKAKGANDAYVLKNVMRDAEIDTKKEVKDLIDSYLDLYDKEYKEARGDGDAPRRSRGTGGDDDDKILDDYFAKKAAEGKFPQKQQ